MVQLLGLQVNKMNNGIFICQSKYTKNLVKKFGLETSKYLKTHIGTNDKLSKDDNGVSVDPTLFRSMIGSLLYLISSRLTFVLVSVYAQDIKIILKNHILMQ